MLAALKNDRPGAGFSLLFTSIERAMPHLPAVDPGEVCRRGSAPAQRTLLLRNFADGSYPSSHPRTCQSYLARITRVVVFSEPLVMLMKYMPPGESSPASSRPSQTTW